MRHKSYTRGILQGEIAMVRVQWIRVGRYARKIEDGKGVHCKVCDRIINYDPETKQELRHSCKIADHPQPRGSRRNTVVLDDDVDDSDFCSDAGRLERGMNMLSYGEDLIAVDGISQRW